MYHLRYEEKIIISYVYFGYRNLSRCIYFSYFLHYNFFLQKFSTTEKMELDMEDSYSSDSQEKNGPGVQRGTKRQKYRSYNDEKRRVIEAALRREDWEGVALANNVNLKTAYSWMRTYVKDALPKKRGGARNKKITQLHVDAMTSYVEQDQLISLHLIKLNIFR